MKYHYTEKKLNDHTTTTRTRVAKSKRAVAPFPVVRPGVRPTCGASCVWVWVFFLFCFLGACDVCVLWGGGGV